MGFFQHEAVIVFFPEATWEGGYVHSFLDTLPPSERKLFAGPIPSLANASATYFMAPDGSKEGWPESDRGMDLQDAFIAAARQGRYPTIVSVRLGGDDDLFGIVHYEWQEDE